MKKEESIKKTANAFEESFLEASFYDKQTKDKDHLSLILKKLNIRPGMRILDLGTGSGYLAFALSEKFPACQVVGLDIVEQTMARNSNEAAKKGLSQLSFISYDGIVFPFEDQSFDIVVTRYALHHFPEIEATFKEISRITKPLGQLLISDPTPHKIDNHRFVDRYMQIKDDGHIRFYTPKEYKQLAQNAGFIPKGNSLSQICFPRKDSHKYLPLLDSTDQKILKAYTVMVVEPEVFITENVLNMSFRKKRQDMIKRRTKRLILASVSLLLMTGFVMVAGTCFSQRIRLTNNSQESWNEYQASLSEVSQKRWNKFLEKDEEVKNKLWAMDIDRMVAELEEKHVNLYHTTSKETFSEEVQELKSDLTNLTDIEKYIRLSILISKINEGHTSINGPLKRNKFPLVLEFFDDGVFVMKCFEEYEQILGYRLSKINGIEIEDVLITISDMVFHENPIGLRTNALNTIRSADYLAYYSIIDDTASAQFEFISPLGEPVVRKVYSYFSEPAPADKYIRVKFNLSEEENLVSVANQKKNYWFEYLPDSDSLYLQYNSCWEMTESPIEEFTSDVLTILDEEKIENLILDLRYNGGGSSILMSSLLQEIKENERINQEGNLFVMTGKKTFSSAIIHAVDLDEDSNALLVGRPTAGAPNHYGNVKFFLLPHTGLKVTYSTKYFQISTKNEDSLYPDISVEYLYKDYITGNDPDLNKVIEIINSRI